MRRRAVLLQASVGDSCNCNVSARGVPVYWHFVMFKAGDCPGHSPTEAQLWIEGEKLDQVIEVPGCYSPLYCNAAKDHCLVITGMGKANAVAHHHGCWIE